jgi:hypothetical protein
LSYDSASESFISQDAARDCGLSGLSHDSDDIGDNNSSLATTLDVGAVDGTLVWLPGEWGIVGENAPRMLLDGAGVVGLVGLTGGTRDCGGTDVGASTCGGDD